MTNLTKKQALDLLPAVVDHEVSEDEKLAFLSFIEKNEEVKKQYESAVRVKNLLNQRYQKAAVPPHFKEQIYTLLDNLAEEDSSIHSELQDSPSRKSVNGNTADNGNDTFFSSSLLRYCSATAVILLIIIFVANVLDKTSSPPPEKPFIVENYVAKHFLNSNGSLIEPHFATSSTREAEQFITEQYQQNVMIPHLTGVNFSGVVMADFYEGFKVPMLEYEQMDVNEMIYIFAFNVDDLEAHQFLQRNEQAVNACVQQSDFHVLEVDGRHVVSWLWQDKWYTAISNFNGYDLASLIEPLEYTP